MVYVFQDFHDKSGNIRELCQISIHQSYFCNREYNISLGLKKKNDLSRCCECVSWFIYTFISSLCESADSLLKDHLISINNRT